MAVVHIQALLKVLNWIFTEFDVQKPVETCMTIVSGSSVSALQHVKISAVNSAIVTPNSCGGSATHLQPSLPTVSERICRLLRLCACERMYVSCQ